jgi:hypothetical protein
MTRRPLQARVARGCVSGLLAAAVLLAGAAAAPAAPMLRRAAVSRNWAGYVTRGRRVRFRYVSATWIAPTATCGLPYPTYSATWVGLGGFSHKSSALEQVGTELDCTSSGTARSYAWYELVPAPSRRIRIPISPGDAIVASVAVIGRRVTLKLADATEGRSFAKTVNFGGADVTTADWIVEAPSACMTDGRCHPLPLADFESVQFSNARATSTAAIRGAIASPRWARTRITLEAGVQPGADVVMATASALMDAGSAFSVTYAQVPASQSATGFHRDLGYARAGWGSKTMLR